MFEIVSQGGRFRILRNGELLPAKFHVYEQAATHIFREEAKIRNRYRSRTPVDGNLPDIYGDNLQNVPLDN